MRLKSQIDNKKPTNLYKTTPCSIKRKKKKKNHHKFLLKKKL